MNADEAPQTAAAALLTPPKQIRARRDVVFVHGLIGSFCEPETFRALGDDVACWAPDLYGYGADSSREITTARQVSSLREYVLSLGNGPVHLVAHSIGAVYAFELADARPDLVESLTTVEGNFSLKDAFWSQALAALGENEARQAITARLSDPAAFLASDGITLSPELLTRASNALAFQPWSTVWASAKAILTRTSQPDYQEMVSRVFGRMPVYLIGGERSASQWDVQDWARDRAAGSTVMAGVGHMMMLEAPTDFGRVIKSLWQTQPRN
jgi:pimeloyl-ACP methyl ester carboxylesterase